MVFIMVFGLQLRQATRVSARIKYSKWRFNLGNRTIQSSYNLPIL